MSEDTTTQSRNTDSTFPHLSWQECELHFDNLLARVLVDVDDSLDSIFPLLIWQLADTLHKGRASASTRVESVASTLRSEAERYNTQAWSPSLKSLKQLSDAAHKTVSEVVQAYSPLSYLASGNRRHHRPQEQQRNRRQPRKET